MGIKVAFSILNIGHSNGFEQSISTLYFSVGYYREREKKNAFKILSTNPTYLMVCPLFSKRIAFSILDIGHPHRSNINLAFSIVDIGHSNGFVQSMSIFYIDIGCVEREKTRAQTTVLIGLTVVFLTPRTQ